MRLEYEILELPTAHDFRIAREGARLRRSVWLRLIPDDGPEGWGEAAATPFYGESAESVCRAFEELRGCLGGISAPANEADVREVEEVAGAMVGYQPSALAALSSALLELHAKSLGTPIWKHWQLDPANAPVSSFTIGLDEAEAFRAKVREAAGYPILKVKLGSREDARLLEIVRQEAPASRIRVDANTGWSVEGARELLQVMEEFEVELIEQPLAADDYDGLARVKAMSRIPIVADESCRTSADVVKLEGCVDGINIKLAKCGSLLEARRMIDLARERGMSVMLGCMVESTLGIAAALQLAPLVDYVDLDGAVLLARDPFVGPGMDSAGRLHFNEDPGLGVRRAGQSSSSS